MVINQTKTNIVLTFEELKLKKKTGETYLDLNEKINQGGNVLKT